MILAVLLAGCGGGDIAQTSPSPVPGLREVRVTLGNCSGGGSCKFDPADFEFDAGESARFELVADDEFHTFTAADLGIDIEVNAHKTEYLDFTFDRPGEYALICIPHEALGMKGTISVR